MIKVARGGGTERAWTGKYNDNKEKGGDMMNSTIIMTTPTTKLTSRQSTIIIQECTIVSVVALPSSQARKSLTLDLGGPALWIV